MITKEKLIEFGMVETSGDESLLMPLKKVIAEDAEDGCEMSIGLSLVRNVPELCLLMPSGDCLFLVVETIEELKIFEKCIASWEPNY